MPHPTDATTVATPTCRQLVDDSYRRQVSAMNLLSAALRGPATELRRRVELALADLEVARLSTEAVMAGMLAAHRAQQEFIAEGAESREAVAQ